MRISLVFLAFLFIPVSLIAQSEKIELLSVTGTGTITDTPDLSTVNIRILEEDEDYQQCLNEAMIILSNLSKSFKKAGFDEEKLKTSSMDVREKKRWQDGKEIMMGYQASARLSLEFPFNNNMLKKALDVLSNYSNQVNYSIGFNLSEEKEEQLNQKAIEKAIIDAKAKADIISKTAGIQLVKIIEIQYGPSSNRPVLFKQASFATRTHSEASRPDINPNEIRISQEILIRWSID